jgi:hypothetical protein
MKYRVHRFPLSMARDQAQFESFLNGLKGDVVSVIPNVTIGFLWIPRVDFVLIVEKLP